MRVPNRGRTETQEEKEMTREEIYQLARGLEMGVHARLTEHGTYMDDLVEFAERVAARAVEEYLEQASAEFDESIEQMLEVHGKKK